MRRHAKAAVVAAVLFAFPAFASSAFADYSFSGTFSGPGSEPGELSVPGRAAVEQSSGDLFVADSGNDRVQVFAPNASGTADYLTKFGEGELSAPWGIAIDEDAGQTYVYVADAGNERIVKYDSDGAATPSFTVDPSFTSPTEGTGPGEVGDFHAALAVDPTTHDLLVADHANKLVERFTSDGGPVGSFDGSAGVDSPGAFSGPLDIAVNSSGDIYVVDADGTLLELINAGGGLTTTSSRVERFDAAGEYQASLGPVSGGAATVAVEPGSGKVVVGANAQSYWNNTPPLIYRFATDNSELSSLELSGAVWSIVTGLAPGPAAALYAITDQPFHDSFGAIGGEAFEDIVPPTPEIAAAEAGEFTATLHGTVNPNGSETACHFNYSTDTSLSEQVACVESPGSGTSPVPVHADLTGLQPNTTYHVRLVATKSGGAISVPSDEEEFTTAAAKPLAVTMPAAPPTAGSALIGARINPRNSQTSYYFEWGMDSGYGGRVPAADVDAGDGNSDQLLTATLANLQPDTVYHYRVVASNTAGETKGADQSFRTLPTVPAGSPERGFEMVSPADKNGNDVFGGKWSTKSSVTGDAVIYNGNGAFPGTPSSQSGSVYLARRGAGGWSSTGISPPITRPYHLSQTAFFMGFSDDLSRVAVTALDPPLTADATPDTMNLYLRSNVAAAGENPWTLLTPSGPTFAPSYSPTFAAASANFSHVLFEAPAALTGDASATARMNLYEWSADGGLELIEAHPGDGAFAGPDSPDFGADEPGAHWGFRTGEAMSRDGSRVYFTDAVEDQVYLREGARVTEVSSSQRTDCATEPVGCAHTPEADPGGRKPAYFAGSSADGHYAFFVSAEQLTDEPSAGRSLYRYDADSGHLENISDAAGSVIYTGNDGPGVIGVSETGNTAYFVTDQHRLYVWRNGETHEIGQLSAEAFESCGYSMSPQRTCQAPTMSRVSPDGSKLLFNSSERFTAYETDGTRQFYLYDADSNRTLCVSCNPRATHSSGDAWGYDPSPVRAFIGGYYSQQLTRTLSADGRRVFFESPEALVAADTNGRTDVYMWEGGAPHLISTGKAATDSHFADASASGDDVFFTTDQRLVAADTDQNIDLYVARVGAVATPAPTPARPCEATTCRGPQPASPAVAAPGSSTFNGPSSRLARHAKAKKKRKQAKRCAHTRRAGHGKRCGRQTRCAHVGRDRHGKRCDGQKQRHKSGKRRAGK